MSQYIGDPIKAKICVDGWAGRQEYACEVTGETKAKYICRMLEKAKLPRRWVNAYQIVQIPKTAVRFSREMEQ